MRPKLLDSRQFVELTLGFIQSYAKFRATSASGIQIISQISDGCFGQGLRCKLRTQTRQYLAFFSVEAKTINQSRCFNAFHVCCCSTWVRGKHRCIVSINQFIERTQGCLVSTSIANFAAASKKSTVIRIGDRSRIDSILLARRQPFQGGGKQQNRSRISTLITSIQNGKGDNGHPSDMPKRWM